MALSASLLANDLENRWLGGDHPASNAASAERFADCVASWFANAMANGIPCATALARKAQLQALATPALGARQAQAAASGLSLALVGYIAGQMFGPGVASAPLAVSAASSQIQLVFADLESSVNARAQRIASAVLALSLSTLVVFPPPTPPAPVT